MSDRTSLKSILVLAANPIGTVRLRTEVEHREIKNELRKAVHGKNFINYSGATRIRDIQREMLYIKPQVVHFSGHGAGKKGLVFEDGKGEAKLVDSEALANLFRVFTRHYPIECVVLNACYSEFQAQAIACHVGYVIGMSEAIGDRAAIEFSVGFYAALAAGESFKFAYELGCNAIELEGIPEHLTPIIWEKGQLIDTRQNNLPPKTQVPNPRGKDISPIQEQMTADKEAEYQQQQEAQTRQQEQAKAEYQKQQQEVERQQQRQQFTPTTASKAPRDIDYTKLRDLLASEQWREADQETLAVMLKAANRGKEGYLDIESIAKFPCTDLRTIDQLWVKYSIGRFGFSVQKRIWESVGGKADKYDYEIYCKFGLRVGWRKVAKKWLGLKKEEEWLLQSEITYDRNAPQGHLPIPLASQKESTAVAVGEWSRAVGLSSLASRLVKCNI